MRDKGTRASLVYEVSAFGVAADRERIDYGDEPACLVTLVAYRRSTSNLRVTTCLAAEADGRRR